MKASANPAEETPGRAAEEPGRPAPVAAARWRENRWVWAGLVAVLVLYVFSVLRLRPIASFGVITDDGVYFSSAKSLADGQGYLLPSFPGHLPSMKYPELYPLLLAGVWKLDSHFPGNVAVAVGISLGFGGLALLGTFLMLRRWPELGDWSALGIVLLVALSWDYVYYSSLVVTDVPFAALLVGAAWLAEMSVEGGRTVGAGGSVAGPHRDAWLAAGAGVLAGLSVGLRALGIPVAAGIGLLLLWRRKFRELLAFCVTGLPLTLWWSWPAVRAVLGLSSASAVAIGPTQSGWTQAVCYYSSYACEWRMRVPHFEGFLRMVVLNLRYIAQDPGEILVRPLGVGGGLWSLVLVMLLSVVAYIGIVRSWRRRGCRPLHAILPLYLPVVLVFPYDPGRYLLALSPLFLAGLWMEGQRFGGLVSGRLAAGHKRDERVAAWVLGAGALAVAVTVGINYAYAVPKGLGAVAAQHQTLREDEAGAYNWISRHAAPNAPVIANEDGLAYLVTGRPAVAAIRNLPAGYYPADLRSFERYAEHLGDIARHIGAAYWLATVYDYLPERSRDRGLLLERQGKLLANAPVVYRSADGWVTLYDTRCVFGRSSVGGCNEGAMGGR